MSADDVWAATRALGEQISAAHAAKRRQQRDNRNARRRAAYRAKPRQPRTAPVVTYEPDDLPAECRCNAVAMPPCTFCENGGEPD